MIKQKFLWLHAIHSFSNFKHFLKKDVLFKTQLIKQKGFVGVGVHAEINVYQVSSQIQKVQKVD